MIFALKVLERKIIYTIKRGANKMIVKEIIKDLVDHTVEEVKQEANMRRIQISILDPIISYSFAQLYPYIIITSLLFFFTFVIAVAILIFVMRLS
jgi:hypothetical protein